ncbi:hypothetical protein MMC28_008761 [Mycoblastus sanguinarius]|nr:hypothetical protein [Mycoblastus sanguinarius]
MGSHVLSRYQRSPFYNLLSPNSVALALTSRVLAQIAYTILYVLPFYLSPATRPSPALSRDAPSVIRARIRFVSLSVSISSLATIYVLSSHAHAPSFEILHLLGWYPISPIPILQSLLVTALLFAGPLFEKGIVESAWRQWIRGKNVHETLSSWIGWRNYVAGPVTEEILFRSLLLPLHLIIQPSPSPGTLIFTTPLYFGIAHIHHFYEYILTHPLTPLLPALLRSLVQFGYTTVFGWYATFLFLRTGSLWAVVVCHAFCNWMGLPRVWGRVGNEIVREVTRGKENAGMDLSQRQSMRKGVGVEWTVMYYVVLVAGAVAFYEALWGLTESDGALAKIP